MTTTLYDFEGGTGGGNVGAGGGITAVSSTPPTYQASAATHSSTLGVQAIGTQWAEWDGPDNDFSFSVYVKPTVNVGTGSQRFCIFRTAGGAIAGAIRFHSDGHIGISNATNVLLGNSTVTWTTTDQFRFDCRVNTIAPDVEIRLRVFKNANVNGTTPDDEITHTLPTVDVDRFRLGGQEAGSWNMKFDNLRVSDLLEWLGPYSPAAAPLATPVLTVTDENAPTAPGGTDGSIVVTWPAITGADHYEAGIADGHGVTSGFSIDDLTATSPHTFAGLAAGNYTVAIRAIP